MSLTPSITRVRAFARRVDGLVRLRCRERWLRISLRGGPVDQEDDARAVRLGLDELQLRHVRRVLEQPAAATHYHRVNEQPVLVDQTGRDETVNQRDAAGNPDLPIHACLQRPDLVGQVAA
jgi:hypothetical protein